MTMKALASRVDSDERRVFNPTKREKDANAIAQAYNNDAASPPVFQPKVIQARPGTASIWFRSLLRWTTSRSNVLALLGTASISTGSAPCFWGTKQRRPFPSTY